jgi:tyrosyl-tRNA synthetase
MGRTLQKDYGQPSQIILTMPILEGTDGVQKMSKSYGNYIGINEPPQEIYGKVMSISDELMWRYYELLTDVKVPDIEQMKADAASGKQHPMQIKKALARRIVQDFHGEPTATAADENWAKQFQKDEVPADVEICEIQLTSYLLSPGWNLRDPNQQGTVVRLNKIVADCGLADSTSDAARKIKQSAVRVNGKILTESNALLDEGAFAAREFILQVGRKVKRIKIT